MLYRVLFFALVFLAPSLAARATWNRIDDRLATAADFYDQETGLVAFSGFSNVLTKITVDGQSGVYSSTDPITSIGIQDSNTAWAVVAGRKLMRGKKAWTDWTLSHTSTVQLTIEFATTPTLFVSEGGKLEYTTDGVSFTETNGLPANSVTAIDYLDPNLFFATTTFGVYRSNDSGHHWALMKSQLRNVRSVYADRTNALVYVGGDTIIVSSDSGASWSVLKPPLSLHVPTLDGQVYGTHDCTGTFYLTNGAEAAGDILRSTDLGLTLVTAGRFPASESNIKKGFVFDRGSTFYWWNADGAISVTHDGIDSLILEGIVPEFYVSSISKSLTLCPDPTSQAQLRLNTGTCTPIQVDSVTVLNTSGTVNAKFKAIIVGVDTLGLSLPYTAHHSGVDNVKLRVWYRTLKYPKLQSKDVTVRFTITSFPAVLVVDTAISFGKVTVGKSLTKDLTITNTGCDTLRIDSVASTNTVLYTVDLHSYPVVLKNGDEATLHITFAPTTAESTIEALEVGTNAGHRFIEISGTGVTEPQESVGHPSSSESSLSIYPNPATHSITLKRTSADDILIYDLLGRERKHVDRDASEVTIEDLPNGEYLVRFGQGAATLIIQR